MRSIIAFSVAALLFSHSYLYLYNKEFINVNPGISSLIVVILGAVSHLIYIAGSRKHDRFLLPQKRHRRYLIIWFGLYTLSVLISYVVAPSDEFTIRAFKTFVILSALLVAFFAIYNDRSTLRAGVMGIVFAVLLAVVNNYLDLIIDDVSIFSSSLGRAAGFYVNPNIAGLNLVLGMILSISYLPSRLRLPFCLLVGSAVILTFSRASILVWTYSIFFLAYFGILGINKIISISIPIFIAVFIAMLQTGTISISEDISRDLSENALQRITYDEEDESVHGRLLSAQRALDLFLESPVLGHGLGSNLAPETQTDPHNQYLIIAVERGGIGLLIYLVLFVLLWKTKSSIAQVFSLSIIGFSFFTHNLLDFPSRWMAIFIAFHIIDSQLKKRPLVRRKVYLK